MEATTLCRTVEGTTLDYDTLAIFTLVEEDGELKVLGVKDFANPEQRGRLHSWVAQALAKGVAAYVHEMYSSQTLAHSRVLYK